MLTPKLRMFQYLFPNHDVPEFFWDRFLLVWLIVWVFMTFVTCLIWFCSLPYRCFCAKRKSCKSPNSGYNVGAGGGLSPQQMNPNLPGQGNNTVNGQLAQGGQPNPGNPATNGNFGENFPQAGFVPGSLPSSYGYTGSPYVSGGGGGSNFEGELMNF